MLRLEDGFLIGRIRLRLERQLTRVGKLLAILAVLLKGNNTHIDLVLHQETVLSLPKSNEELKRAELSAPLMHASLTLEFEIACLDPLHDEEFVSVPLFLILLNEHFGESFLASPLD